MRGRWMSLIAGAWLVFFCRTLPGAVTNCWMLASPDGRCEISVFLGADGALAYEVSRAGKTVIGKSPLGLRRDDQEFERGLVLERAGMEEGRREAYELFAGTAPRVDHLLNKRSLFFRNRDGAALVMDLAASGEGVAFRYRFPETNGAARVLQAELTGFAVPSCARGWLQPYHEAGDYTPAYEDFYFHVLPGNPPPESRAKAMGWSFPALFHVSKASAWVLLTESGTDASFCACHLGPDSTGGLYRIAFPAANEATKGQSYKAGPEPRWTLPWTMPWRVIVMGGSAGDIAMATLVTDLAAPARIADTSWIRPGRVSWAWWSYPDGPNTAERFNQFTDFAARMGWEYTLFDSGWWDAGLAKIASHARSKGVTPLAWLRARDFYSAASRKAKLDEMESAGVRGVKVDFWCSDRQEAMAAMQALLQDAAERRMSVTLHGCTIPRGWQRTWPNLLTVEAVLGNESYLFEPRYTKKAAELNTVLPFTRNAVGPMDNTPAACSPKKYARRTTAAHELAAALIVTSGLVHYADKPGYFESLPPEALQIFRDAPARWDETRCLIGEPGRTAVMARRAGESWFIAGINGANHGNKVTLDLSAFHDYRRRIWIAEGVHAAMEVAAEPLSNADHWSHKMPPRGGFILRLDR